jgi:hypothetical protein
MSNEYPGDFTQKIGDECITTRCRSNSRAGFFESESVTFSGNESVSSADRNLS